MNHQPFLSDTKIGIAGGTLTALLLNVTSSDVIKTVVLAGIGAMVSFIMSQLLKKIVRWWKNRRN
jgi:hypothetical protein